MLRRRARRRCLGRDAADRGYPEPHQRVDPDRRCRVLVRTPGRRLITRPVHPLVELFSRRGQDDLPVRGRDQADFGGQGDSGPVDRSAAVGQVRRIDALSERVGYLELVAEPVDEVPGRAAEVLGIRQASLRSLNAAGAVRPQRTAGGRRRYSRRQLAFAAGSGSCQIRATPWPRRCASWTWKTTWPQSAPRPPTCTNGWLARTCPRADPGQRGPATRRPDGNAASGSVPSGSGGLRPVPSEGSARPAAGGSPPAAAGPGGCRPGSGRQRSARRFPGAGRCPGESTGGYRPRCALGPAALPLIDPQRLRVQPGQLRGTEMLNWPRSRSAHPGFTTAVPVPGQVPQPQPGQQGQPDVLLIPAVRRRYRTDALTRAAGCRSRASARS